MSEISPVARRIMEMGFNSRQANHIVSGAVVLATALRKPVCPLRCAEIIVEHAEAGARGEEYDMTAEVMRRAVITPDVCEACDEEVFDDDSDNGHEPEE